MTLCSPNKTPTSQTALGSDPEGPPIKENWKYPSVVGMLLNLSTNRRPDTAFAVSQVAQFTSNPKLSYAVAVKMFIRYLSAISDQGIIFAPSTVFKTDCYVDADFACLYGREPQDLSASACSYRIHHVHLLLPSDLEKSSSNRDCLNTFHTEYVALFSAIRKLITIQ